VPPLVAPGLAAPGLVAPGRFVVRAVPAVRRAPLGAKPPSAEVGPIILARTPAGPRAWRSSARPGSTAIDGPQPRASRDV